ncbi:MAG: glutamate--tRNA ligase family protein [Bryobacterales bacterium]
MPFRRTRYAPSPTGYLHLGHVAHMLWVWGYGRKHDAEVILRIEDHDRGRCRPEYEDSIYEDLRWLGFDWANTIGHPSLFRQSDNDAVYAAALEGLAARGLVYRCDCSRKRIAEHSRQGETGEWVYSGYCRDRNVPADRPHGLRLRLEPGEECFDDLRLGKQTQIRSGNAATCCSETATASGPISSALSSTTCGTGSTW